MGRQMMFGRRIRLFKLLGFAVHIDMSWLVLALLITWSLARGLFPYQYEKLSSITYWSMGAAGALGMFASIIFHELCHSLVARRFGLPMKGITLFIFGGVAEMDEEPPSPKAEFFMAIAGPASSILLGLFGYVVSAVGEGWLPVPIAGVLEYLTLINFVLAGFNLVPAFPLDGGRVLRSALWQWKKNFRSATRIASKLGSFFGTVLIFLGVLNILRGNVIGGIWQSMIGFFLGNAARMSYHQVLMRKALEGGTVRQFMNKEPVIAQGSLSLKDLVEGYIYRYHFKMFPVVEGETLVGCITTRRVKEIPHGEWSTRTVGEVAVRCSPENTIGPDEDAIRALGVMSRTGNSRLMVVEDGRLVGIITLKDIMGLLAVKLDLEEEK
jgi:Zn-dependent protease/predicted transcriptional regulator